MSLISYTLGQGSVILRIKILNSSVATGAGLAGLTSASSDLIVSTIADNEATATVFTGVNLETITTLGTFVAPTASKCRFKEVDASNHPGVYEIQIADARFNIASSKSLLVSVSGATNVAETDAIIPLTQMDPYDNVRMGITALPNAVVDAAGGLVTSAGGATGIDDLATGTALTTAQNDLNILTGTDGATLATAQANYAPLKPTVAGRDLDITATGAAGIDWGNIENKTTVNDLSATDIQLCDTTTTNTDMVVAAPTAAVIADAVWDETLSDHNTGGSAGKRLSTIPSTIIRQNTAQGPGTGNNQIQLDINAGAVDGTFDPSLIFIEDGTGSGQSRLITQYDGGTQTATVGRNWKVKPDATSKFIILADAGREHVNEGLARAGTANTIKLNALASTMNDIYNGQIIFIRSGTGEDQVGTVISYVGSTQVATVHRNWKVIPDTTSGYSMLPGSPVELTPNTIADIKTEVSEVMFTDATTAVTGVPAIAAPLGDQVSFLLQLARNKATQTATLKTIRNDADTLNLVSYTVSDDGTTFTRAEGT